MLKSTLLLLAVSLASSASAAGWRALRVDASSQAALKQSLAQLEEKLSPGRRYALREVLKDVWVAGTRAASDEQRDYTEADYYRQIDGLSYEEIVTLVDPTGETARRYRAAYNPYSAGDRTRYRAGVGVATPNHEQSAPMREAGPNWRGGTPLFGPSRASQ